MDERERALQDKLAARLLHAEAPTRDAVYREVYEDFHTYLRTDSGRKSFLYRKLPLGASRRALSLKARAKRMLPWWCRSTSEVDLVGSGFREVLELGCGEGWLTLALALTNDHVVGVDISDQCIDLCRRHQQEHGMTNIEFFRQSGIRLELADQTFDRVVSTEFLEHLHPDDVPVHLAEVRRVLKPGGRYLVVTPNRHRHHEDDAEGTLHLRLYSYADLAGLFEAAGFSRVLCPFLKTNVLVDVRHKIRLERLFERRHWRKGWGGTGLSSVTLCGVNGG